MALTYTTAVRDQVALRVYGKLYANTTTQDQTILDAEGAHALAQIVQYGKWFTLLEDPASLLDEWEFWLVSLSAYRVAQFGRPDRIEVYEAIEARDRQDALLTYTRLAPDVDASGATHESRINYTLSIRQYILGNLIRRDDFKFIPVEQVDHAIYWAVAYLWNLRNWNFRRRQVLLSISTASAVTVTWDTRYTVTPTTDVFDSFATRHLYLIESPYNKVTWATADEMSLLKARLAANSTTGAPQLFRFERRATESNYFFYPTPDQTYTARAEVFVSLPIGATGIGDPAVTVENAFKFFPSPEFEAVIRDLALWKVLSRWGMKGSRQLWLDIESELERTLPLSDDHGDIDVDSPIRDVYNDPMFMGHHNQIGGAM